MKNAFAIVTLSALMATHAMAQTPVAPADAAASPSASAPAAPQEPDATSKEGPAGDELPKVELSSDLLYKLTKAEMEFKSGQWQGPYVTMMVAAQQTRDPRLARRASEMALAAKQGSEALAAIRLWRELAPDSDEATQFFLGFVVLTDKIEEAEPIFAERLANAPQGARGVALFQMQQILSRSNDKLYAYSMVTRLVQPYLDMFEAHLVLAQGALSIGERDRAIGEANKALAIKPNSELAVLTLAQVTGEPEAAGKVLAAFLQKNPDAVEVRGAYARLLVEQKQLEPARDQFLLLLKSAPDNVGALYALGIVALQLEDTKGAEQYFKRFLAVLEKSPGDTRDPFKALMILSQIAETRGDTAGAIAWLDKVDNSASSGYVEARLRRAQLIARGGNLDAARKALTEIETDDPASQAQVLLVDAQFLRDAGYVQSAYTVLENALLRFPDNPELLYDYALLAERMDKFERMEASLRRVMALAPDNQHAYNALGYSLAERGLRLEEAHALIEKALQMAPGDPFIMDSMGWVQFRMGNLAAAENALRRAYAVRSDPEIAVHLGEVLWQKGDKAEAQKLWREAQGKDPKNEALKSTLARLNVSL
ncbi:beta-barrel assembly-enhancing protease [Janthinobacterium sp. HH103]|uniref:tetratricopeptide repeat protein n=1 Tax=unclassified Janthinobacterium TaxID=2610881 RepID=UPI000874F6E4|nr:MULTISPECIES: tetratricopeptide repeat protein [unclassified Janthinobacterium]OEZ67614.1 beta-barrel assembly-enhancing protease [Janthinobacterium sp. HH100]OEZ74465.1 beta-barrel assembly-enhancing protease [Janthinobacterium sp. HH103]OEZ79888.1 beta-barrel assembly-enhancing protease [Janthinobacterium sp. HH106]QOU71334.1 Beta-barrel assembly-enhancing protease [Janthinobacterium sp. HH102]